MWNNFFHENFDMIDAQIIQLLAASAKLEHLKKGDYVVEAGERQLQIPFLVKGVLRGFVVDENGQDITDCFACRSGDVVCGCNGITGLSPINMEALTDCDLLMVPVSVLENLLDRYPELGLIYNKLLTKALKRHWEIKRILYQSAMQRYQWFLENYPGLINRVSNKHIASFLGMTPVTLSRLRRRLREENEEVSACCQ